MFLADRNPTNRASRVTPLLIAVGLMLVLSSGCRTTRAPARFVPRAEIAAQTAVGSWVEVEGIAFDSTIIAMGELVAVTDDSIALFDPDTLHIIPMSAVGRVRIARYHMPLEAISGWALLGTLSTVSHGFWFLLSAPAWTGVGIGTAVAARRRAIDITRDVARIRPYARFPQGIPASVDRKSLVRAKRPT